MACATAAVGVLVAWLATLETITRQAVRHVLGRSRATHTPLVKLKALAPEQRHLDTSSDLNYQARQSCIR